VTPPPQKFERRRLVRAGFRSTRGRAARGSPVRFVTGGARSAPRSPCGRCARR
jgi:hypothetical protein